MKKSDNISIMLQLSFVNTKTKDQQKSIRRKLQRSKTWNAGKATETKHLDNKGRNQ